MTRRHHRCAVAQLAALDLNDRVAETDRFNRAEESLFVTEVARRGNRWMVGGGKKGEKKIINGRTREVDVGSE